MLNSKSKIKNIKRQFGRSTGFALLVIAFMIFLYVQLNFQKMGVRNESGTANTIVEQEDKKNSIAKTPENVVLNLKPVRESQAKTMTWLLLISVLITGVGVNLVRVNSSKNDLFTFGKKT